MKFFSDSSEVQKFVLQDTGTLKGASVENDNGTVSAISEAKYSSFLPACIVRIFYDFMYSCVQIFYAGTGLRRSVFFKCVRLKKFYQYQGVMPSCDFLKMVSDVNASLAPPGDISYPCPQITACPPPNEKCAPPKRGLYPKESNRLHATRVLFSV